MLDGTTYDQHDCHRQTNSLSLITYATNNNVIEYGTDVDS